MGIFKSLVTATAVRYLVAMLGGMLGTFLIGKGWISADTWEGIRSALDAGAWPFVSVLIGGGSIIAAITAALTGINEAGKDKSVVNGVKVKHDELPFATQRSIEAVAAQKAEAIGRND